MSGEWRLQPPLQLRMSISSTGAPFLAAVSAGIGRKWYGISQQSVFRRSSRFSDSFLLDFA